MQANGHQILVILASLLGGGVGVSLFAQLLKKVFKMKTNAVIHTMVIAISVIASVAQYILQLKSQLPPVILGISLTSIYGISQVVFKYSQYAGHFFNDVKLFRASQVAPVTIPVTSIDGAKAAVDTAATTQADF